jgi:high-affinity iron transporter
MAAIFLIVFRESLEAALVVGIVLAFLSKAGLKRLYPAVWSGAAAAVAASVVTAALFLKLLGEFEGKAEQLFEASIMLAGAALLTTLILWIGRGDMRAALEGRATAAAGAAGFWGIALLVFTSILREGTETVVFLGASLRDSGLGGVAAGLAGLVAALALGILVFAVGLRMRHFFAVTNGLLILFAAGLVGRAAGELVEAGALPPLVDRLWDLNPSGPGAAHALLREDGAMGSLLKGLFGYSATPSLAMALAYVLYLAAVVAVIFARRRRQGGREQG